MAYVITQPCIGVKDGACVEVCPVDAIHPAPDEVDYASAEQLYISEDCIDCGMCVHVCPVNAIFASEDVPAQWESFIEKNAAYFRARQAQPPADGGTKQ